MKISCNCRPLSTAQILDAFVHRLRPGIRSITLIAFLLSSIGNFSFVLASGEPRSVPSPSPAGTPAIAITPDPVNFGKVVMGTKNSQTMRLSNPGTATLTVTKVAVTGADFSVTGLALPFSVAVGTSITFTTSFKPSSVGSLAGSISITANIGHSMTINLSGVGITSATQLTSSATSLNLGSVTTGTTTTKDVSLANTGNTEIGITMVSVLGTGFATSGAANVTLMPGQSTIVAVSFDPKVVGSVQGTLTIASSAPTLTILLSAQGVAPTSQHKVSLTWSPSTSTVEGYNVYRSTTSGGPYSRLNGSLDLGTSYSDQTVVSGKTYYYVVTAVGKDNGESAFSRQISATIPNP